MTAKYNVKNKKVKGMDMVEVSIGKETMLLTTEEAYAFAEVVSDVAGIPGFHDHLDNVFSDWGNEGGTC